MESPRQESWSQLPFPSPGNLPNSRIQSGSPALQVDSLPSGPLGSCLISLRRGLGPKTVCHLPGIETLWAFSDACPGPGNLLNLWAIWFVNSFSKTKVTGDIFWACYIFLLGRFFILKCGKVMKYWRSVPFKLCPIISHSRKPGSGISDLGFGSESLFQLHTDDLLLKISITQTF